MNRRRALLFVFSSFGPPLAIACAASPSPSVSAVGEPGTTPTESGAPPGADGVVAEAPAGQVAADGGLEPRCTYGPLSDPHHGFVRCLTAEEADAGWQPPSQGPTAGGGAAPPDAGPPESAPAPLESAPPPMVEVGEPAFENGQVKTVHKVLTGLAKDIGHCVGRSGGLAGATGSLKVQFLVRSGERAEGVEVLSKKGIGPGAAACIKGLLKNRWVGTPSADPVGVTVSFTMKAASP